MAHPAKTTGHVTTLQINTNAPALSASQEKRAKVGLFSKDIRYVWYEAIKLVDFKPSHKKPASEFCSFLPFS